MVRVRLEYSALYNQRKEVYYGYNLLDTLRR